MKSLLIKTGFVVLFLFMMFSSWASDIGVDPDLPWYKEPWAWIIPVTGFVVLAVAFIKTGEKKQGRNHEKQDT